MSREEFIGKLQMVYVGDRNAFNDIVCAYDSVLSANEKASEYIGCHFKDMVADEEAQVVLNILQNGGDDK